MKMKQTYSPLVASFIGNSPNYIASPTALANEGSAKFALDPVGAGPFEVVSDELSTKLVLKRFPNYWETGKPYLDGLIFRSIGSGDQGAVEALQAGSAQAYERLATESLVPTLKQSFNVQLETPTEPYFVQLNETKPPFNNLLAREAIYYATNASAIDQALFDNVVGLTEGFTATGGLFYEPTVPGFRTYDLAKAKALVKQLGGLSFSLGTNASAGYSQIAQALYEEYEQAGMNVKLDTVDIGLQINDYKSDQWQGWVASAGSYDPGVGAGGGLTSRFLSTSYLSGVKDPNVNKLIVQAEKTAAPSARAALYDQLAAYLAANADGVFLFPAANYNISAKDVHGPGFTTPLVAADTYAEVPWEDVWMG
jgi:peptide/nickel transport system substrate-binding protein